MIKLDVPYISQSGRYPTGCESVSAVMLLHYLGYPLTVDDFIGVYLEKEAFEERDGKRFGPHPEEAFCGSPYDEDSFGCYAPVVCRALDRVFAAGRKYRAADETNTPVPELLHRYIDRGMPVLFWACIDMREPIQGPSWELKNGGGPFTWVSNEHCMLLVGYDEEGYYFNDPYENHGVVRYPRILSEDRHAAQHRMAVGAVKI